MKSLIINPETAEFFDFKPSTADDMKANIAALEIRNDARILGQSESSPLIIIMGQQDAAKTMVKYAGSKFFSLRVKAEGKLGNRITSIAQCSLTDTACKCVLSE